jgi:hypothetical protein
MKKIKQGLAKSVPPQKQGLNETKKTFRETDGAQILKAADFAADDVLT